MKRIFTFILFLTTTVVSWGYDIAVVNAAGVTIYYNYINDATELEVTFKAIGYTSYSGSVVIPEEVTFNDKTLKVTSIGNNAFYGLRELRSIEIPNSVTSIGGCAFQNCKYLTSAKIGNSVTSIGGYAFCNCSCLTSVEIPNSVTSIGGYAFCGCSLTSIEIPNSVTSIGGYAFCDCSCLTSIEIPNSVTSIGGCAFQGCKYLTSAKIGNSVTSIADCTFMWCQNLSSIEIPNSVTSIGSSAFEGTAWYDNQPDGLVYAGKVVYQYKGTMPENTHIQLKEGTVGIGDSAFSGWSVLTSIEIPNSVTSIGTWAFSRCSGLTSIEIPNSVTSIGDYAFYNCSGLTSVEIPNSVKELGSWAFEGCSNLQSVTLSNNIPGIGERTFYKCHNLTSITIPSSVAYIGKWAFGECKSLSSVIFDDGNQTISMALPEGNSRFADPSFEKCPIESVYLGRPLANKDVYPFRDSKEIIKITIGKSIKEINTDLVSPFKGKISSITIPHTVEKVMTNAFHNFSYQLTSVTIEDGDTPLDLDEGGNFYHCSLNSLYLGRNMKYTTERPFSYNREGLNSVTIGPKVTELGDKDFYGNKGITSLTIMNGLQKIGGETFYSCKGLTEVNIPSSVKEIGAAAFSLCEGLTKVVIEDSEEPLHFYAPTVEGGIGTQLLVHLPLTDLYIGRNITKDEAGVISLFYTNELQTLTLGSNVSNIPNKLSGVSYAKLKDVFSYAVQVPENTLRNSDELANASLHVPVSLYKTYYKTTPWNGFGRYFAIMGDGQEQEAFKISYQLNGEEYASDVELPGNVITALEFPTGDGYASSGWSEIPAIMPDHNVTITGTYTVNSYNLTYIVDGVEYKTSKFEFGQKVSPESEPAKEGYTFSGWSEIPETMPAYDVTITGSFAPNKYKITYMVDGVIYKTYEVEYGTSITAEENPTKEGYTFSGWSSIPETMPANDVTIIGGFTINSYTLIYVVDGVEYKTATIEYGKTITPESVPTKEGYTFTWTDLPETMPANDVTVTGTYTINKYKIVYMVDGVEYGTSEIEYGAEVNPIGEPSKEGYTFSGWEGLPDYMPAKDVTVTGTFTANKYKVTFMYGDNVLTTIEVTYGAAIELPESLNSERYTLVEWKDVPDTMPAHDIIIYADYVDGINTITADSKDEQYIRISGMYTNDLKRGVNIIRTQDGKTMKVWVK